MIAPARRSDLPALAAAARTCTPPLALTELPPDAWTLWLNGLPAGMVGFAPVPGLAGVFSLHGFVAPGWQRRGWGSRLLAHVTAAATVAGARRLTASFPDLDAQGARFLRNRGFTFEHEERQLRLPDLRQAPPAVFPPGLGVTGLPGPAAVETFFQLFAASFAPHPWYQPYAGSEEIAAEMAALGSQPGDLLFLTQDEDPIGFAWLRRPGVTTGEIEPIGLHPKAQGRGWGRLLLLAALNRLREAGCTEALIGAWEANRPALHLYESVGFMPAGRIIYLARDIHASKPSNA